MFLLLEHLNFLQLSMATLSLGTGLMLGSFVGAMIPVRTPSGWQN
jgi:hypothetical protein